MTKADKQNAEIINSLCAKLSQANYDKMQLVRALKLAKQILERPTIYSSRAFNDEEMAVIGRTLYDCA